MCIVMIVIKNEERTIKIDNKQLQSQAQRLLELLDYADFDVGILLTNNTTMQQYNKTYRNQDKPTDILSFPFHPDAQPSERIVTVGDDEKNLGDLIIAPAYVAQDAPNWGQPFDQRMTILLIHGLCHLLGYDHIDDADYEIMKAKEEWLLGKLKEIA